MVTLENNILKVKGHIVSNNAPEFEKELFELYKEGSAVLDALELEYISSAGLRVFLKLIKTAPEVTLKNVSSSVYDILETTGFTELMKIEKVLRSVSIEGCEFIGKGGHGSVYKLTEDMIIKTFHDGSSLEDINREREFGRNAFISGVPCAIAFDVVSTEEGYGLIYEMAGVQSLSKFLMDNPDKIPEYCGHFADLLKSLHEIEGDPEIYVDIKSIFHERIDKNGAFFTEDEVAQLHRLTDAIPNGKNMIHGDYHPNNVMIDKKGELLLIDMADISLGLPILDISNLYTNIVRNPDVEKTVGISREIANQLWQTMLESYYGTSDIEELGAINKCISALGLLRTAVVLNISDNSRHMAPFIVKALREHLFPNIENFIGLFKMAL